MNMHEPGSISVRAPLMLEMLTPCLSLFVIPFYGSFRLEMRTPCLTLFVILFYGSASSRTFGESAR